MENQCLAAALAAFPFEGKIVSLQPFGAGHINDTYAVSVDGHPEPRIAYILQRLNTHVFKKPAEVMENIVHVTEYIRHSLRACGKNADRGVLHFLTTLEGERAFYDMEGMPWRSYRFIEHSYCHAESPTPALLYQSGRIFGEFLYLLRDYPVETLHETIPDFHNTPKRLAALQKAVQTDSLGRAAECEKEIAFVMQHAAVCHILHDMLQNGELPLRVTHNDTKLNNVLFDIHSKRALCVIDLDTIMPGLSLHDFGDSIRFGATTASEDERDIESVRFSLPLFDAYTKGYLETAGPALTKTELEYLAEGARTITLECGIRFLTDYLEGDIYFKTERPEQNLDRCRTQFKLVSDMERSFDSMREIIQKYTPSFA